jgi:hypothetical protein
MDFDENLRLVEVIAGARCTLAQDDIREALKPLQSVEMIKACAGFHKFEIVRPTSREDLLCDPLPGLGLDCLFGLWLRAGNTPFQEFDLAVVVGFVFGDVKPFGVVAEINAMMNRDYRSDLPTSEERTFKSTSVTLSLGRQQPNSDKAGRECGGHPTRY